jgi:hypothetical protein
MEIEQIQFQQDLLDSVREMNAHRVVHVVRIVPSDKLDRIDPDVSSSATYQKNVSLKLENGDT